MNQSGEILKITNTNESGRFRFTGVDANATLYIRLENMTGTITHASVNDLRISGSGYAQAFENIYFDFDHYTLRPEAIQVLNDLAGLLKRNANVQVELYAYADDRGADDYNLRLTQKRGDAVFDYLMAQGIDQTALAVIAKGKQAVTSNTSEIQRQLNRRVEFYLNGDHVNTGTVKTYILKEKTDWKLIAEKTGITETQLRSLNGATAEFASGSQPIRLPSTAKISTDIFYSIR